MFNPEQYGATRRINSKDTPPNIAVFNPYEFGAKPKKIDSQKQTGDNWLPFLGKSLVKGATSLADIPQAIEGLYNMGRKIELKPTPKGGKGSLRWNENAPQTNYTGEYNINSEGLRKALKNQTGLDLTPRPSNSLQELAGVPAEFIGGSLALGGLGNLAKAGSTTQKILGTTKNFKDAARHIGYGTAIGGTSGTLRQFGVDPLAADLAGLGTVGIAGAGKNLLNNFAGNSKKAIAEQKIQKLLKDHLRGAEEARIIDAANATNKWNIEPITAEVAQSRGLSNLHNAFAPNIEAIAEKQALNDAIIRSELEKIGNNLDIGPNELGELSREEIVKKLTAAEKNRLSKTKPLYDELEASKELYPIENFNKYSNKAIEQEVGANELKLKEVANILPKKYSHKIKPLQDKLDNLKQASQKKIDEFKNSFQYLSPEAQKQLLKEYWATDKSLIEITDLEKQLAQINNKYTPGHIDKTITELGNRINQLKASTDRKNNSLLNRFTNQKNALTKDLELTPEGAAARNAYAKHSGPVNAITQDELLKKYIQTNEFNQFIVPEEKLANNILKARKKNIENYMTHIAGTPAEPATKAYFRNQYIGKAPEKALPTYDKSNKFLKKGREKLGAIYNPEELRQFIDIDNYLKNRSAIENAGKAAGSPTATRSTKIKAIESQIGKKYQENPLSSLLTSITKKIPFVGGKINNYIEPHLTFTNPAHNILEDVLRSPKEAARILRLPLNMTTKGAPPYLNPLLTNIVTRNLGRE